MPKHYNIQLIPQTSTSKPDEANPFQADNEQHGFGTILTAWQPQEKVSFKCIQRNQCAILACRSPLDDFQGFFGGIFFSLWNLF